MIIFSFYGDTFYQQRINPLVGRDLEIMHGKRDEAQLFHGRMSRWRYGWNNFKDAPVSAWLFGYPTSLEDPFFNISISIHNDYLRIFYLTGLSGILAYILFLFNLWRRKKFIYLPEKFLLYGSLSILLLYSVSTTPTFYPNFLYILFIILVYFSLPLSQLVKHE
jgi:O-antigen ligase